MHKDNIKRTEENKAFWAASEADMTDRANTKNGFGTTMSMLFLLQRPRREIGVGWNISTDSDRISRPMT